LWQQIRRDALLTRESQVKMLHKAEIREETVLEA
jgi:hypothetical protein